MFALNSYFTGLSATRRAAVDEHAKNFATFKDIKQMANCRQAELRLTEKKEAAAEKAKAVAKKAKKFDKKLAKLTDKLAKSSENLQKMAAVFDAANISDAEIVETPAATPATSSAKVEAAETITAAQFELLFSAMLSHAATMAAASGETITKEQEAEFRKVAIEQMTLQAVIIIDEVADKAQPSTVTEVEGDTVRTTTTMHVEATPAPKADLGVLVPEEAQGAIAEALRKANNPKGNRNKGNNAKGTGN